jgi:hypothetical protein
MKGLRKVEIYRAVINGLDAIPKPLEGKGPEPSYEYAEDMREAFKLSRKTIQSDNMSEMNANYRQFRTHIIACDGMNFEYF